MTAPFDVRSCTDADWTAFTEAFGSAFGFAFDDASRTGLAKQLDISKQLVAVDGATVVGTAGVFDFTMTVPGGEDAAGPDVPTAGVTLVGVRPTHRRRGILRQLMRRQLDEAHERGQPLAILWASEASIYQRFGYGLGTLRTSIDIGRGWTGFLHDPGPVGQVRYLSAEESLRLVPDVYERARRAIPGSLRRPDFWWEQRRLADPEWARRGGSEMFRTVLEIDGRPEAYALYRAHNGWGDDGLPTSTLEVIEALGTSTAATREIWRFLFGIDIVTSVRAPRLAPDHPLFLMLADPRRLRSKLFDGIWLRVVDAAAALAARRYGDEGKLTIDLRDPFCPWNEGVWTLEGGPDGADVARSDAAPDVRLSAGELGAMYLGTVACSRLARAGRVEELRAGGLRRADALFRADVGPWCLDDF